MGIDLSMLIGERTIMSKQKVEQSTLTLLNVEVDAEELNTKLFGSYADQPTFNSKEKTEGQIVSELMHDSGLFDELLEKFSNEKKGG